MGSAILAALAANFLTEQIHSLQATMKNTEIAKQYRLIKLN